MRQISCSNRAEFDLSSLSLGQRGKFSERRAVIAVSAAIGRFVSSPDLFPFKHALGDPIRSCYNNVGFANPSKRVSSLGLGVEARKDVLMGPTLDGCQWERGDTRIIIPAAARQERRRMGSVCRICLLGYCKHLHSSTSDIQYGMP
jgi:hypothetical protein